MEPVETCAHKRSLLPEMVDFENDEETMDMGCGSNSETESSSSMSGTELGAVGSRCRFGCTRLETMPATPVGTACRASQRSPPGLSRTAMRQARDACKVDSVQSRADAGEQTASLASGKQCRFGITSFGTIPATPPTEKKLRVLANAVGSPPGLSRASMRQERDACKLGAVPVTSWGASSVPSSSAAMALSPTPSGVLLSTTAVRSAKTRAVREAMLLKARQGASQLKFEAESQAEKAPSPVFIDDLDSADQTTDAGNGSTSEEGASDSSSTERRRCRFGGTTLETVPATPSGTTSVVSCRSPPGLSRASLRQARDACKVATVPIAAWGDCHKSPKLSASSSALLSISACGKPLTPSSLQSAKRRAALARLQQQPPMTGLMFPVALSAEPR